MNKDWTGNTQTANAIIGTHKYNDCDREINDYYATDPRAAHLLMEVETFSPYIWECACGEGHLAKEFEKAGYHVWSTDLIDRGYGQTQDFLTATTTPTAGCDIITNPPYAKAQEFVQHALELVEDGRKVAMFLKIQFLEGKSRKSFFQKYPPKFVYVSSSRLRCVMNGDFGKNKESSAFCYAWYVWEKGYAGDPIIKWIN